MQDSESANQKGRKIVKAKRKEQKQTDENLEDLEFEDSQSDEFEEEDVV